MISMLKSLYSFEIDRLARYRNVKSTERIFTRQHLMRPATDSSMISTNDHFVESLA
jgi:hypothetical protein